MVAEMLSKKRPPTLYTTKDWRNGVLQMCWKTAPNLVGCGLHTHKKKPQSALRAFSGTHVVTVGLEPTTPSMWTMCSHIFTLIHSRFINVTSGFAVLMITSHCTPTNRLYTLWMMPVSLAFTIPNNTKKPGCSKVGCRRNGKLGNFGDTFFYITHS